MSIEPFSSDLEAIAAELEWAKARVRRQAAEERLRERIADEESEYRRRDLLTPEQALARIERYRAEERALREGFDDRAAVSVTSLDELCARHELTLRDRILVLLAAAPSFSVELEFSHRSSPITVTDFFDFLELPPVDRISARSMFRAQAPLRANDLVSVHLSSRYNEPEDLLQASVTLTWSTFRELIGDELPEDELLEFSSMERPLASLSQLVLDEDAKGRMLAVVDSHGAYLRRRKEWGFDEVIRYGRGAVLLFHGKPGTGKTMAAHALAAHLGKRVLNVDVPTFANNREQERFMPALFREARHKNAVLFFDECEALFASRRRGNVLMNLLLTEIERFDGVAILATNLTDMLDPALERRILVRVPFPMPDADARAEIWRRHMPPEAPLGPNVDFDGLASRYELAGGYIKNAVLMAVAATARDGRDCIRQVDFETAAATQRARLEDEDDEKLAVPKVRLDDVVLEAGVREEVQDLIDAANGRDEVLKSWGIGTHLTYGRGVVALFAGPPGTGKTLCAQAVAGELGRPLLTCAMSAVLSRWVGGTESNLERAFDRARREGAVLFLDEADAWLRNRSSMNAEHAHRWVNLLLTLIEGHNGVVLLASNLPDALDEALSRRLGWSLRFDRPDAVRRADIWRRLLPETVPGAASVDVGQLASNWALTGAQIRNAVFRAAFAASRAGAPVTTAGLARAAQRELARERGAGGVQLGLAVGDA